MAEHGPDRERMARARELYIAARQKPEGEREAFLASVCGENRPLLNTVRALLAGEPGGAAGHQDAAGVVSDQILDLFDEAVEDGKQIGPYTILQKLGEGGFGIVYLAERREPMVQRVALKVIKPGMDSKAVVARFEQERQALAVMDHPNIAKVFDAGTTERGHPYFVMEYVQGEPITGFCDRHTYTLRQRLELFVPVCEAVQHAHMKGLIHRDIKPSNVLVSIKDGQAIPKVIDFGVAKAISRTMTEKSIFTEHGLLIGTPEYMSPEQAEMGSLDVDTRTDVYSLGVMLYELLTGLLPFDSKELRSKGYAEIQRIIREVDPPSPSKRLTTIADASAGEIARRRHSQREAIQRELRRELEWVPLKAMRKDRAQRYSSSEALAADIRRFLKGRPLEAGPESAGYRVRKFVRRNQGKVITAGAVSAAVVIGSGATLWQWKIAQERDLEATAFMTSLEGVLDASDPNRGGTQNMDAVESVLKNLDVLFAGKFKDAPGREADLRLQIADILYGNGAASAALPQAEQALEIYTKLHRSDHPDVADAMKERGLVLLAMGREGEAEQILRDVLAMRRRMHSGESEDLALDLNNLGGVLWKQGKLAEAEGAFREALTIRRSLHPGENEEVAQGLKNLGLVVAAQKHYKEAEAISGEALAMYQHVFKKDHPRIAETMNNLGFALQPQGQYAEAEKFFRASLKMNQELFKGKHPAIAGSLNNVGYVLLDLDRAAEAEPLFREAVSISQQLSPMGHRDTATYMKNLAKCLEKLGRLDAALDFAHQALVMADRTTREGDELREKCATLLAGLEEKAKSAGVVPAATH